jgi:hypothetical protein
MKLHGKVEEDIFIAGFVSNLVETFRYSVINNRSILVTPDKSKIVGNILDQYLMDDEEAKEENRKKLLSDLGLLVDWEGMFYQEQESRINHLHQIDERDAEIDKLEHQIKNLEKNLAAYRHLEEQTEEASKDANPS